MINSFWDKFYKNKGKDFFWPWTDLVTLASRHLKKKKKNISFRNWYWEWC